MRVPKFQTRLNGRSDLITDSGLSESPTGLDREKGKGTFSKNSNDGKIILIETKYNLLDKETI